MELKTLLQSIHFKYGNYSFMTCRKWYAICNCMQVHIFRLLRQGNFLCPQKLKEVRFFNTITNLQTLPFKSLNYRTIFKLCKIPKILALQFLDGVNGVNEASSCCRSSPLLRCLLSSSRQILPSSLCWRCCNS